MADPSPGASTGGARAACPKCGFGRTGDTDECARCGLVFAKWDALQSAPTATATETSPVLPDASEPSRNGRLGASELKILGAGLAAALLVYVIAPTRFIFSALVTLLHELGHAIAAWVLGHPAVPAFDFVYGGGFTHHQSFQLPLAILIGGVFAFAGWVFRRNGWTLVVIAVLLLLWLVPVTRTWRRELVIASAGHLAELVLAGILFYQALSGTGWRVPEAERPLGAFAAFFVLIHVVHFAMRLRTDPAFLAWYREGKGGALMNDLESVALDLQIHFGWAPGIEGVAGVLLLFAAVPFAAALAWHLRRERVHRVLGALLRTDR